MSKVILTSIHDLPRNKKKEYNSLKEAVINSGYQFGLNYDKYDVWEAKIDTPEKKAAIKFILGDLLEIADLNFESSLIINTLPQDLDAIISMNWREFKLTQEIIQKSTFRGRENHIKLAKAMKSLNEDGASLLELETENKMFAKDYQECGQKYSQFCMANKLQPENIELLVEERLANSNSSKSVDIDTTK